jgi:hypothetical protein
VSGHLKKLVTKCHKLINHSVNKKTGCINWEGGINGDGYGYVYWEKFLWRVPRLAWTLVYGAIPKGFLVCHKCDNRACFNVNHLFLGTITDNNRDRAKKNRNRDQTGEKNNMVKLTKSDVKKIRALYAKNYFQREIGAMFGVTQTLISRIVRRKAWKKV